MKPYQILIETDAASLEDARAIASIMSMGDGGTNGRVIYVIQKHRMTNVGTEWYAPIQENTPVVAPDEKKLPTLDWMPGSMTISLEEACKILGYESPEELRRLREEERKEKEFPLE